MSIEWEEQKADELDIRCPYCNHQAAPPVYPYCGHTVFVYIDPSVGDPGFDFVTAGFAAGYCAKLKTSKTISQEEGETSPEAIRQFVQGNLPTFDQQEIRLFETLISDDLFSSNTMIFDATQKEGYYPTRIVIAFESNPRTN